MSENREPNYKGLFYLSLFFIALGIAFAYYTDSYKSFGSVFIVVGGLLLMISMRHRDKWIKK